MQFQQVAAGILGLDHQDHMAHGCAGGHVVAGFVVGNADIDHHLIIEDFGGGGHRHRILHESFIIYAGHQVVVNRFVIPFIAAGFGKDIVFVFDRRHVAILAGLAGFGIAVGAVEPFAVGVVHFHAAHHLVVAHHAAKHAVVAGGAKGAFFLQRQVGDAPGDVVVGAKEKLLTLRRAIEFHRRDAGFIGIGQLGFRVQDHIADFMAKIARNAVGGLAGELQRADAIRHLL